MLQLNGRTQHGLGRTNPLSQGHPINNLIDARRLAHANFARVAAKSPTGGRKQNGAAPAQP